MELLCAALDDPQRGFRSLHVVGTNGKSSVTSMTAAMLAESGLLVGSCLSPHIWRWSERTRIGGTEIDAGRFGAAAEQVAAAIVEVEASLPEEERITQFEAAIACSFVAFDGVVDVAVIEAGLGGRLDATNVLASSATALTSVGLDHVEWLGRTEIEIATEKLAVLREDSTLVVGQLSPEVARLAAETARERRAQLIEAPPIDPALLSPAIASVPYLARNAAVAVALARVVTPGLRPEQIGDGLAAARLPGRAEAIAGEPPLIADAAHNVQGARALAEALPQLAAGRPVIGCLSILAEKDAKAIVAALAGVLDQVICTAAEPGPAMGRPGARATDPDALARMLVAAGVEAEVVNDPAAAIARTLDLAAARSGVALCAGSHYLLRYAWTAKRDQSCSR